MKRSIVVAVVVVALIAVCGVASEASKRPYTLFTEVSVGYTDNRDSSPTETTSGTDVSLSIGLGLQLEREALYMLDLGYQPSILYRLNPSESQNNVDMYHDLKLNGWYRPNRLVRLHLVEALNYTDDPAVDSGGATIRRDASFFLNRASVGAETELSRRTRLDITGTSMFKRYSDSVYADIGDEDSLSGTVSLGWLLDRLSIVSVYGSYGEFSYPGDSVADGDRGFAYLEAGVSFRNEISKMLQSRVDVAYKRLDYANSALGSDQSPCGYATLQVSPSPRLRFSGSAGYVLRDSDVEYFSSQRYTETSLRAEWDALMPQRLTVGLSGGYRVGKYKADSLSAANRQLLTDAGFATDGQETTTVIGADLTYRLKTWLAVSIMGQHEDVRSDLASAFDRSSVGLRTRIDF